MSNPLYLGTTLTTVEEWQFEFEWLQVRHFVKATFQKKSLPDLNAILFVIGMQELGIVREKFTKEEKQDLMHIAVCRLLSQDGYFELVGYDTDGWPHWKQTRAMQTEGVEAQEQMLKEKIIAYFQDQNLHQTILKEEQ